MATYVQKDFEWVRGTTPRIGFRFRKLVSAPDAEPPVYEAIPFDDIRFTIFKGAKGGELLTRYTLVDGDIIVTDVDAGQVEWTMRADDTRALNETAIGAEGKNRYEVELRNGTDERVFVLGKIAGIGGINDDEQGIT